MITEEKDFEVFWQLLRDVLKLNLLTGKGKTKVRNWTAQRSYSIGGHFHAWAANDPKLIGCDTLRSDEKPRRGINKAEMKKLYPGWDMYSKGQLSRSAFQKSSVNSTYIIAIFKQFENLMLAARKKRMSRENAGQKGT